VFSLYCEYPLYYCQIYPLDVVNVYCKCLSNKFFFGDVAVVTCNGVVASMSICSVTLLLWRSARRVGDGRYVCTGVHRYM
jgi:hypothetical protein